MGIVKYFGAKERWVHLATVDAPFAVGANLDDALAVGLGAISWKT